MGVELGVVVGVGSVTDGDDVGVDAGGVTGPVHPASTSVALITVAASRVRRPIAGRRSRDGSLGVSGHGESLGPATPSASVSSERRLGTGQLEREGLGLVVRHRHHAANRARCRR